MQSTRAERPEQLYLEIGRYSVSVTTIVVTIVFVLVAGMLANSVRKSTARAGDWQRRAVAAEEIVGGLRVVLAERSRALNERTRQANRLVATVDSSRGALRESKSSVGELLRDRRRLESDRARAETARRKLQKERAALASVAAALDACSVGLEALVAPGGTQKPTAAEKQARLEGCERAREQFRKVMRQTG